MDFHLKLTGPILQSILSSAAAFGCARKLRGAFQDKANLYSQFTPTVMSYEGVCVEAAIGG